MPGGLLFPITMLRISVSMGFINRKIRLNLISKPVKHFPCGSIDVVSCWISSNWHALTCVYICDLVCLMQTNRKIHLRKHCSITPTLAPQTLHSAFKSWTQSHAVLFFQFMKLSWKYFAKCSSVFWGRKSLSKRAWTDLEALNQIYLHG